jgi:HPt (histidine-containing phosphotransfer) domain-containing protein
MIFIFYESVFQTIAATKKSLLNADFENLQKIAHKIKPSIDNLEIKSLKESIRKLEKCEVENQNTHEIFQISGKFAKCWRKFKST